MLFLFVLGTLLNLLELRVYSMRYGGIAIQGYECIIVTAAHFEFKQLALPLTTAPRNVSGSPRAVLKRFLNPSCLDL
jgi:hypothetical protein